MARRSDAVRQATGLALVVVCLVTLVGGALLTGSSTGGMGGDGSGFSPQMPGNGNTSEEDPDRSDPEPTEHVPQNSSGLYSISVSDPVRPGRAATITVERDDRPVEGVGVSRNGEFVGRTDQFGRTTDVVPYVATMAIVAERASDRTEDGSSDGAGAQHHPALDEGRRAPGVVATNESVPTTVGLVPLREPRPGRTVTFLAHVEGAPVAEGRVFRNGDPVGRTDVNGRFGLEVAWNESTTVAVERGEAAGERAVRPAPLDVSVTNAGTGVIAAGQSVTVRVTQGGRPVDGAAVTVGDADHGKTDVDGTTTVTLPHRGRTTVEVQRGDMESTTTLDGLYLPYVVAAVGVGVVVFGLLALVVFRGQIGATGATGYGYVTLVGRSLAVVLVQVANAFVRVGSRLRETLGAVAAAIRQRDPVAALALLGDRITAAAAAVVARVRSLLGSRARGTGASQSMSSGDSAGVTAGGPRQNTERGTIRRAFDALLRRVPGRVGTLTPTEIGQRAVDHGLPADAVWTIADTFRAVTYGGRDPETLVDDVDAAADRLRGGDENRPTEDET